MLPKKLRATRSDIEDIVKNGQSIFGKTVYAKISKKEGKTPSFSFIVPKKAEKTSVGRHAIKRFLTAYVEMKLKRISPHFQKTLIFWVSTKLPAGTFTKKAAREDIDSILEKVGFFG